MATVVVVALVTASCRWWVAVAGWSGGWCCWWYTRWWLVVLQNRQYELQRTGQVVLPIIEWYCADEFSCSVRGVRWELLHVFLYVQPMVWAINW